MRFELSKYFLYEIRTMCKRCAKLDWAGVDKVKPKVRFKYSL